MTEKHTILIIENDRDILELYTSWLKNDFNVLIAVSPEAGQAQAKISLPDLIILDQRFEESQFTYLDVIEYVRKEIASKYIPIMILTAFPGLSYAMQALEKGANHYLTKPIMERKLRTEISAMLDRQKILYSILNIQTGFVNKHITLFISHHASDDLFVTPLAHLLSHRGFQVWYDHDPDRHNPAGQWEVMIQQIIDSCQLMILVLSPKATQSIYVMDEYRRIAQSRKPLIPVIIQSCTLPLGLSEYEYVEYFINPESGLRKLLKMLDSTFNGG